MPAATVSSLPVDPAAIALLPGCDFADTFAVTVPQAVEAPAVAAMAFATPPDWVSALMGVRNAVMGRLGYKTAKLRMGFPVLSSAPDQVLMGLDDGHLDFRAVVRVERAAHGESRITLTTLVKRHNTLGRVYLGVIMPFHKLIVRSMLARLAARLNNGG